MATKSPEHPRRSKHYFPPNQIWSVGSGFPRIVDRSPFYPVDQSHAIPQIMRASSPMKTIFSPKSNMECWISILTDRISQRLLSSGSIAHNSPNRESILADQNNLFPPNQIWRVGLGFPRIEAPFVHSRLQNASMAAAPPTGQVLNAPDRVADIKATKLAWNLVVGVVRIRNWLHKRVTLEFEGGNDARKIYQGSDELHGQVAVTYPKIFEGILEKKYLLKLSVTKRNTNNVDQVYIVVKDSDDEALIEQYSSHASVVSEVDQSVSNGLGTFAYVDGEPDLVASATVSLSKESASESNCADGLDTPAKSRSAESQDFIELGGVSSVDVQGSNNKTFCRVGDKRKSD
ncbi:hypothetical protein PIB30_078946 [Stylosanthes scabra]|uniref:Uncharacterized protein n=1 Tax=Stylosanthes scabra TaxID=79078 RepID=A0ABU6VR44_9FABA|nr:hypothetical protein [Stylosanthes scabra]